MHKSILGRVHVTADGFLIGHVVPKENPANQKEDLKPGHVYEAHFCPLYQEVKFVDLGPADFQPKKLMGMDRFVFEAGGRHLTVSGLSDEELRGE